MFSKLSLATLAFATAAFAQTHTNCDPTKTDCPPDPALGRTVECDFTKGACPIIKELEGTNITYDKKNGAVFAINVEGNAPTVVSDKYIFFGRVDVVMQAAPGAGIVSSTVLQSDDLDEIDWEFIGSDNVQAQTNYFSRGDTSTYDRGAYHHADNPTGSFHTYSVEWTSKQVNWMIDGKSVRVLDAAAAGAKFPQTPMQVRLGTWCAGGKGSNEGTRQWAGGFTDFTKAPFNAYYKSITIVDYAGKDSPANGGIKEYVYGDKSGTWQSIKVVKGDGSSSDSSASASASGTSKASSTTKTDSSKSSKPSDSSNAAGNSDNSTASTASTNSTTTTFAPSASASASSNSTISATLTTSSHKGSSSSAPTTAPTIVPGAAPRSAAAMGGALLVGAGVALVQLL